MAQINLITSGGQTGADLGALMGAREVGIQTGGWAPRGFRTEGGAKLALDKIFGLQEHPSRDYAPRTMANIEYSDMTWIFMFTESPGSLRTLNYCLNKKWKTIKNPVGTSVIWQDLSGYAPVAVISSPEINFENVKKLLEASLEQTKAKCLNIAGNRESVSPGIQNFVKTFVIKFFGDNHVRASF